MARILAIDYGRKRTGLAVTDPMQIIANGLQTVASHEVLDYLGNYLDKNQVERFVVGYPKTVRNEESEAMQYIKPFVKKLEKRFPDVPVTYVDERFTSVLAQRAMITGGMKKKDRQNKANVDRISATIILQTYLESTQTSQGL